MAMKPCRECGTSVSTTAKSCPECGASQPAMKQEPGVVAVKGCLGCLGVAVLALTAILLFAPTDPTDDIVDAWMEQHPSFGTTWSMSDMPDWARGERRNVYTMDGGDYVFYLEGGRVVTVRDINQSNRQIWP